METSIKYTGGFRHIRQGHLTKLGQLTTENENFKKLSVADTDRQGNPLKGAETRTGRAYQYFRVCPDTRYSFKNYFRTDGNKKHRTGETPEKICDHIKSRLTLENPDNTPKLIALKACNDVVLNAVKDTKHAEKMHMRELLLLEQVSRQLEKLKSEDVNTGRQIQFTLDWIDDLLASKAFRKIGVGGQLSSEQQTHQIDNNSNIRKTAHRVPDSSQPYGPHLQEGNFTGFNAILLGLRNALIDAQVDIESAALHSRKEQDIITINNTMQQVANELAQFKGQFTTADYRLPGEMIVKSDLGETVANFSNRFVDYKMRGKQLLELHTAMNEVKQGIEQLARLDGKNDGPNQNTKLELENRIKTMLTSVEQKTAEYLQPEKKVFERRDYSDLKTGKGQTKDFLKAAIASFDKVSRAIGGDVSTSQIKVDEYLARNKLGVQTQGLNDKKWNELQQSWANAYSGVNTRHVTNLKAMVCDFSEDVLDRLEKQGSNSIYPQLGTIRALSSKVGDAMSMFEKNIQSQGKEQALATLDKLCGVVEQKHDYEQFYTHEVGHMKQQFRDYLKANDFFSHISPEQLRSNMEEFKQHLIVKRGTNNV